MSIDSRDVLGRTIALMNVDRRRTGQHDASSLLGVLVAHGETISEVTSGERRRATRVLQELSGVAEEQRVDEAARLLNSLMRKYCAPPQLMVHDGWPWHLHVDRGDDEPLHRWIGATGSFAMAGALAGRSTVPWGVCAADLCDQIFIHDDRGGPRRHCSITCGTRVRVARHRAKHERDALAADRASGGGA